MPLASRGLPTILAVAAAAGSSFAEPPYLVKDINKDPSSVSFTFPPYAAIVNGKLLFSANDGTVGFELWNSDGTNRCDTARTSRGWD